MVFLFILRTDTLISLYQKGYKVAICEQAEDPKACKGAGKARRNKSCYTGNGHRQRMLLTKTKNNYITVCFTPTKTVTPLRYAMLRQVSFQATEFISGINAEKISSIDENVQNSMPSEIIANERFYFHCRMQTK